MEGEETHIFQVGAVVRDLDKTIEFLTSLGLGPFSIITRDHPAATIHGKKVAHKIGIGFSQQGPVQLELIEYVSGETIQKEFLDEKGEGLHHILFKVRDIDATMEKFAKKGIDVLQEDRFKGVGGGVYGYG